MFAICKYQYSKLKMTQSVKIALENLFERFKQHNQTDYLGICEDEADWQSPCQLNKLVQNQNQNQTQNQTTWSPVARNEKLNFDNINQAFNLELHPDIVDYYHSFYSGTLDCTYHDDKLFLLQAWNQADYDLLQENILGHLLMKQRLKQPPTIFIASTDDDLYLISVLNETGEVVLEPVGKPHCQVLASSISEFLEQLKPCSI